MRACERVCVRACIPRWNWKVDLLHIRVTVEFKLESCTTAYFSDLVLFHVQTATDYDKKEKKQESRAAARKPRDAASVLFR